MFRKLLLATVAALLPVVLLEAGLRLVSLRTASRNAEAFAALAQADDPAPGAEVTLHEVLQTSTSAALLYELRPNLAVRFKGKPLTTDARGFRVTPPGTAGSVRILGLGDSVMFGWGVADSETFLSRLVARLDERHPATGWEAINTAVPGYNTAMEVETLLVKGLPLEPDLVILSWVNNDLDLPSFLRRPPSPWTLGQSFLAEWLRLRLGGVQRDPFHGPSIRGRAHRSEERDAAYVRSLPPELRGLVGEKAFERSMDRLAAAAGEHGFEVLILIQRGRPPRLVKAKADELGFEIVQARHVIQRFLGERSPADRRAAGLVVSDADPHPSPLAHELIAQALEEHLIESGLANRLAAAQPTTP